MTVATTGCPARASQYDDCGAGHTASYWPRLLLLGGLDQDAAVGWLVGSQLPGVPNTAGAALGALFGIIVTVAVATTLSRARGPLTTSRGATQRHETALTASLAEIGRATAVLHRLRQLRRGEQ